MKVIDLFCGCGGMSLGFSLAGFKVVVAADNWKRAADTYRLNFSHPIIDIDLSDAETAVSILRPYEPDVIIGGPPCQDFSSAGKRDEDGGKGCLTLSYADIVSRLKPRAFVMENVERILKTKKLPRAREVFRKAGYGLTERVLDAAYCKVPQFRKRFFLVGVQGDPDGFLDTWYDECLAPRPMAVRDWIPDIDTDFYYRHPRSYARRAVFSVDEPSPTIRGVNRPMPENYKFHPGDACKGRSLIRPLTSAERARIQTFPSDFRFDGLGKGDMEQMVGNAVPVNLACFVATCLKSYLDK